MNTRGGQLQVDRHSHLVQRYSGYETPLSEQQASITSPTATLGTPTCMQVADIPTLKKKKKLLPL